MPSPSGSASLPIDQNTHIDRSSHEHEEPRLVVQRSLYKLARLERLAIPAERVLLEAPEQDLPVVAPKERPRLQRGCGHNEPDDECPGDGDGPAAQVPPVVRSGKAERGYAQCFPWVGHAGVAEPVIDDAGHHGEDLNRQRASRGQIPWGRRTPVAEYQIPDPVFSVRSALQGVRAYRASSPARMAYTRAR